jgi:hypothetical protein
VAMGRRCSVQTTGPTGSSLDHNASPVIADAIRRSIVPMAASAKAALNLICALLGIPRVHAT